MAPLTGLKVLDLSRLLPGPFATMVLADLGATVDKVEDAGGGDYMRVMPPLVDGMNASFHALNRGKRSLVLDLKNPAGRDALLRLVPKYDVIVESFRPGVMAKLGLSEETLRAIHPGLIYCAVSGYGADGPLAKRAGHDLNFVARGGGLGLTGPADGPPQVSGVQVADIGGALFAVIGVLAALSERRTTGKGRFVDIALSESTVSFGLYGIMNAMAGMASPRGADPLTGGIAPYNTYLSKDGVPVALAALEPKFWFAFCEGVGLVPNIDALGPGEHQAALKADVARIIGEKTAAEWAAFAEARDCCLEVIESPDALAADAQHAHRQLFMTTEGSTLRQPRTPVTPKGVARPAPTQGQHREAILRDGGFDAEDIAALLDSKATI